MTIAYNTSLPLQFRDGDSARTLGLSGHETFTITGLAGADPLPRIVTVQADDTRFEAVLRLDTPQEQDYVRHGGVMKYALRALLARS